MAMIVGTVTVDPDTGNYTATGGSKVVMDKMDSLQTYPDPSSPPTGISLTDWAKICLDTKIALRNSLAEKAMSTAELISYVHSNADLKLAQNSIQSGVPSAAGTTTVTAPSID